MRLGSKMESDTKGTLSPMLLEDSPPPDKTKKRAWPRRLQIPLGILIVGLVSAGVFGFLSFTDSKDVERVKAGNFSLGDFQERDRQNLLSTGGCIEEDEIDYNGDDIPGGRKTTANSQECAHFSASIPGGLFWTFNKNDKTCNVKSSSSGRRTDWRAVSGNRKCGITGPPSPCSTASIKILVRKEVGNPRDYFDKSYEEYKEGFAARGESWLGLDALHSLTSLKDYKLKIILTDFDRRQYVAFYDLFKVGPKEDGYRLTVGSFNEAQSTLGDSMVYYHNGMKFSTKDRDQDKLSSYHCAASHTGGWWWNNCTRAHLTGQHTDRRREDGRKQITYYSGGKRGNSWESWKEATMELIPRD